METPSFFIYEKDGGGKTQQKECYQSKAYTYLLVTAGVVFSFGRRDCYNIWFDSILEFALKYRKVGLFVVGDDIADNN